MVVAWVVAALAAGYFWLRGDAWARWVVCCCITLAAFVLLIDMRPELQRNVIVICAAVAAWFLSGVPVYIRRISTRG